MKIVEKDINDIYEYENNPRNNDNAVQAVANSIKEFGFKVPIIIDKDGVIVAGHTRKKAAETLGLKKVPCIIADDLTEEQIKAFRLADNKTAELASWDFSQLIDEIGDISIDMQQFGFPDTSQMLEGIFDGTEDQETKTDSGNKDDSEYKIIIKCLDRETRDKLIELLNDNGYDWSEK